jgi:hypothetical protein
MARTKTKRNGRRQTGPDLDPGRPNPPKVTPARVVIPKGGVMFAEDCRRRLGMSAAAFRELKQTVRPFTATGRRELMDTDELIDYLKRNR